MTSKRRGRAVKARRSQPLASPLDPSPPPGDPREVTALQESEANFRLALRHTSITLFHQDHHLRYTWMYTTDPHLSKVDCLGKHDRDLLPPDEAVTMTRIKRRVLERGISERTEVRLTVDGITLFCELTVTPTYDAQGTLSGLAGTAINITKRKQTSAQPTRVLVQEHQWHETEERGKVGKLVETVMHELNNPLGVIIGFAQVLLQEVEAGNPFHRQLQSIESQAQRCIHLLRQLGDFTCPAPPTLVWADLSHVIHRSLAVVAGRLRQQQITTVVNLLPGLPLLYVDTQQLQQALLHLISNALEAMSQGGRLTIQTRTASEPEAAGGIDAPAVVITVTDTGVGITSENREKIFQPFFTTKSQGCIGLGLAICQGIVHAHGGRLIMDSAAGQGATFSIWLPVGERLPSPRWKRVPF
jgi:two-component system NtrC family sensor kinase